MLDVKSLVTFEAEDGLIEVESAGIWHRSPESLGRLGRGEPVPDEEHDFRTSMRFRPVSPSRTRVNSNLGVARAERGHVTLNVFEVT